MAKAIGMVEFTSISKGIYVADLMVKASDVEFASANPTCPGKYIAILYGDVAAVENSIDIGRREAGSYYVDHLIIPNVHPEVFPAITATTMPEHIQAIGIFETFSMATMIQAADIILKTAEIEAVEMRLGNGIGGKAYFVYTGDIAAVEAGTRAGQELAKETGLLVNTEVIPAPSEKLVPTLL